MDTFDVLVTARSNGDPKSEQFDRQVAMIRPMMIRDPATTIRHNRLSGSRAEHLSNIINTPFEAARVYGTAITGAGGAAGEAAAPG